MRIEGWVCRNDFMNNCHYWLIILNNNIEGVYHWIYRVQVVYCGLIVKGCWYWNICDQCSRKESLLSLFYLIKCPKPFYSCTPSNTLFRFILTSFPNSQPSSYNFISIIFRWITSLLFYFHSPNGFTVLTLFLFSVLWILKRLCFLFEGSSLLN